MLVNPIALGRFWRSVERAVGRRTWCGSTMAMRGFCSQGPTLSFTTLIPREGHRAHGREATGGSGLSRLPQIARLDVVDLPMCLRPGHHL